MKQKKIFTTLVVVVVLLCLNIVYAAITSQTLTINGEVAASAGNEKVKGKRYSYEEYSGSTMFLISNTFSILSPQHCCIFLLTLL